MACKSAVQPLDTERNPLRIGYTYKAGNSVFVLESITFDADCITVNNSPSLVFDWYTKFEPFMLRDENKTVIYPGSVMWCKTDGYKDGKFNLVTVQGFDKDKVEIKNQNYRTLKISTDDLLKNYSRTRQFFTKDNHLIEIGKRYYGGDNQAWEVININHEVKGAKYAIRAVNGKGKIKSLKPKWLRESVIKECPFCHSFNLTFGYYPFFPNIYDADRHQCYIDKGDMHVKCNNCGTRVEITNHNPFKLWNNRDDK